MLKIRDNVEHNQNIYQLALYDLIKDDLVQKVD